MLSHATRQHIETYAAKAVEDLKRKNLIIPNDPTANAVQAVLVERFEEMLNEFYSDYLD